MVEVPIAEIMTRRVISVPPTMPTAEVARLIRERRITGLPVVDAQGGVVGIVSEIDLATRPGATAGAIMSRQVVAVTPETTVREVAALLLERRIRRAPVVAGGRLIGIISRSDLLRLLTMARWTCERCGYVERGADRPARCPSCGAERLVLQLQPPGM